MRMIYCVIVIFSIVIMIAAKGPEGFNGALWGDAPEKVRASSRASLWQPDNTTAKGFPDGMTISAFQSTDSVAGYKASVKYYFYENRFFQATVTFNFDDMKKYDFNYNVYRSVNEYYNYIRSKTLVFTDDIYKLLLQKYGKKEPVFEGLNPRYMFVNIDKYLNRERWNLRYHPYDYYTKIVTAAYARWDFPETRVTFSVAINAKDKRFDYQLSLISLDMEKTVRKTMDSLRMKGL
ncbi:MAG: hypothetical protein ACM31E_02585 [Fibrobacterota bacterium]|nr:hypothetical protein [Chitinispirillaceae bacterium]